MMSLYRVEIGVVFDKLWIRCGVNAYGYILQLQHPDAGKDGILTRAYSEKVARCHA